MPGWFGEDPVDQFRRHVWINPFWEDDLDTVVSLMGADRVIFGSDWPHIEGLAHPLDYVPETKALSARGAPPRAARQRREPGRAEMRPADEVIRAGLAYPAGGPRRRVRRQPACQTPPVLSKPRRGQQQKASPARSNGRCSKPIPSHGA